MTPSIMLFGLGEVGSWILECLARSPGVDSIIVADVRGDWGRYRTDLAAIGATISGHSMAFSFYEVDLQDIDRTARVLEEVRPGVIINTTTLLSPRLVPHGLGSASLGIQLPLHLTLISRLMKALRQSGVSAPVVNVSSADVVNPTLWARGYRIACGAGNCEHVAYQIIRMISQRESVPLSEVTLYFVAGGSAFLHNGPRKLPFYLKVLVSGKDVTNRYDPVPLIEEAIATRFFQVGKAAQLFSTPAASAAKNALAILNDANTFMPVNAPLGLVGDYPARLGAKGAELALPDDLSKKEAAIIGSAALKWFGIEAIREDGTVAYTDEAHGLARDRLGYDCKELHPGDEESRAKELLRALKGLAN